GIAAVFGMMITDYRKLEKLGWLSYSIGGLILITIHFFSNRLIFGRPVIDLEVITIESLMAIPFFFLAWASFFNNNRFKIWHFTILLFLSIFLFYLVTNLTSVYIYLFMIFTMIWWSKFKKKKILYIHIVFGLITLLASIFIVPNIHQYQITRLLAYLNPDKYGDYTLFQLKELLETAGWFGQSLNNEFLLGSFTDFAFVSLTYHYGWIFASVLLIILFLFVARIVLIITKIKDSYGKLLLIGLVAIYSVQLVSNIGMTFGWMPLMPISLPFISYGLMPTLLNAFLIGVALSVYRRKDFVFMKCDKTVGEFK
ncbi:MAG: FtsW/RodA/SpoVE family cell cycle protein, partial [Paenisporosarcina sp.]